MKTEQASQDWNWHLTAVAGITIVALGVRLLAGPRTIDDAYITFRYARNLAQGLGFVYNPGEQVLGTTTPLYTLMMALAWLAGLRDLPILAMALNSLADAATAIVLYWLGLKLGRSRLVAAGAGLAWALSPMSVTFAVGGMETAFVILALVAAFAAYVAGRSRLSAALVALAVLLRPDALIAAGLLLADMGLRPLPGRASAAAAVGRGGGFRRDAAAVDRFCQPLLWLAAAPIGAGQGAGLSPGTVLGPDPPIAAPEHAVL
jgi:hypothetical protein